MLGFLIDLIFPRHCPICDGLMSNANEICCDKCVGTVSVIEDSYCAKCGKPIVDEAQLYCDDCKKYKHYFKTNRAIFHYPEISRSLFKFKYQNKKEFAEFYAEKIYKYQKDNILRNKIDVIIPVPIHRKRYLIRGYNQAQLIAKELGNRMGIPVNSKVVKRVVHTKTQKVLNRAKREKNLEKAFKIFGNDVKLKTVLIVDDIYTTGSTIDEMAKLLLENGAKEIHSITVAIGEQ